MDLYQGTTGDKRRYLHGSVTENIFFLIENRKGLTLMEDILGYDSASICMEGASTSTGEFQKRVLGNYFQGG
jgi:hypothetical protein